MNWSKISHEQKKYIGIVVLMTVVGVCCMFIGQDADGQQNMEQSAETSVTLTENQLQTDAAEQQKEQQLAEILSAIDGVGTVWVKLSFDSQGTIEYAYDEQQTEKETYPDIQQAQTTTLSSREKQQQKTLAMVSKGQGNTEPVIVKKMEPEIVGVLVVAQGADKPVVEEKLREAVETVLGLPAHKVVVMAADEEERS